MAQRLLSRARLHALVGAGEGAGEGAGGCVAELVRESAREVSIRSGASVAAMSHNADGVWYERSCALQCPLPNVD